MCRYKKLYGREEPGSYAEIQKFEKVYKSHRSILDQECAFLDAQERQAECDKEDASL